MLARFSYWFAVVALLAYASQGVLGVVSALTIDSANDYLFVEDGETYMEGDYTFGMTARGCPKNQATLYGSPAYGSCNTTESNVYMTIDGQIEVKAITCLLRAGCGITHTLMKNSLATALACTQPSTNVDGCVDTDSGIIFNDGDTMSMRWTTSCGTSNTLWICTIQYVRAL
jgi:hypothetical protein